MYNGGIFCFLLFAFCFFAFFPFSISSWFWVFLFYVCMGRKKRMNLDNKKKREEQGGEEGIGMGKKKGVKK